MNEVKLNIGAGYNYIDGFVNIDISPKADVTLDLGRDRLPFDDESVDLVFSYHCLEHVGDFLFALGEIYRVLRHGGRFLVGLPYVSSTRYHLVNPYHHHNFNEYSFKFFDPDELKGSAAEDNPIVFKKVFHRYYYMHGFRRMPCFLRNWCRRHLFNVVRTIDFGLLAVRDPNKPLMVDCTVRRAMEQELAECLAARVTYEEQERLASSRAE